MSASVTGYDIREIVIPDLDDSQLEPIVAASNRIRAERRPRAVDLSTQEYRIFTTSPGSVRWHYVVSGEHGPAAYLNLRYPDDGTNPSLLQVSIGVLPEHRRKGIATALLGRAVRSARELGRITLAGEMFDTVPAAASFVEAIGARKTLDLHHNVVEIADLDLELLQRWQREGPDRAPGYSVTVVEGMYPDDLLEGMAHLYLVLERDAPMPEGWEPRNWTGGFLESWLGNFLKGAELITAIVIEDRSGAPAGMSQLGRRHSDDTTWFVTTTMVDPDHRGRALGKWVKAASCLRATEIWPGAKWMETGNAFTNEPMLAINHAMGFRHEFTMSEVELGVDDAEAYLASKSG
ncbi:MAG: GNAT family N-acetyltransferase [Actinobacteria bacterium]|nr:GNAT family N-acetyltransferase [Actinomycetota bacterium]